MTEWYIVKTVDGKFASVCADKVIVQDGLLCFYAYNNLVIAFVMVNVLSYALE